MAQRTSQDYTSLIDLYRNLGILDYPDWILDFRRKLRKEKIIKLYVNSKNTETLL
jgi:hypothetical protein